MKVFPSVLILFLLCWVQSGWCATTPKTVRPGNGAELIRYLQPNTIIELEGTTYDLFAESAIWVDSTAYARLEKRWVFRNLTNVTIRGVRGTEIICRSGADVMTFRNCSDIRIENVAFGHFPMSDSAQTVGVLEFDDCRNITVKSCLLYGPARVGLTLRKVEKFELDASVLQSLTGALIRAAESRNLTFLNSSFKGAGGPVQLEGTHNVLFQHCTFSGNKCGDWPLFNPDGECGNIMLQTSTVTDNRGSALVGVKDRLIQSGNNLLGNSWQ